MKEPLKWKPPESLQYNQETYAYNKHTEQLIFRENKPWKWENTYCSALSPAYRNQFEDNISIYQESGKQYEGHRSPRPDL